MKSAGLKLLKPSDRLERELQPSERESQDGSLNTYTQVCSLPEFTSRAYKEIFKKTQTHQNRKTQEEMASTNLRTGKQMEMWSLEMGRFEGAEP